MVIAVGEVRGVFYILFKYSLYHMKWFCVSYSELMLTLI